MKYFCLIISLFVINNATAALEKGPLELYSFTKLNQSKTNVEVIAVDNVQNYCEKESHKRGFGGFKGISMQACSFWSGSTCLIVVPKMTNNDMLGHELRHCFQGSFH